MENNQTELLQENITIEIKNLTDRFRSQLGLGKKELVNCNIDLKTLFGLQHRETKR